MASEISTRPHSKATRMESGSSSTLNDLGSPPLAPGAPVEGTNPLGHEVTLLSGVTLNLGRIMGSGIFSVPGIILNSVGSIGVMFVLWILVPLFAFAGLSLYTELASMFPNRSGAEVVYLEQAYPKPRFLVPVAFAVTSVLLSFSASNAIVFAQYFMAIFSITDTPARQTSIAVAVATVGIGVVAISTKWSLRTVNFFGAIKIVTHVFIVITGIIVLLGGTRVKEPFANFRDPWAGLTTNGNAIASGLIKTQFAFIGWNNVFAVVGEVRGPNPVRTVRNAGLISLSIVSILFFFINVAYVAAVPREEIKQSGQLVAALFFKHVFGESWAAKLLPAVVACNCLGNIIAVTVGQVRVIREIARQGLLPFPDVFVSTAPFGTPLMPVLLRYATTIAVILALPAKDAFNFLLDLATYPYMFFAVATAVGVWLLRARRAAARLPPTEFRASNTAVGVYLLSCVSMLVMPWIPPESGHSDVSFWYATYCVVSIVILLLCGVYYWIWIIFLPRVGGYEIVEEVVDLKGGARMTRLVRQYQKVGSAGSEDEPLLADS